jgi:hypothetical protein
MASRKILAISLMCVGLATMAIAAIEPPATVTGPNVQKDVKPARVTTTTNSTHHRCRSLKGTQVVNTCRKKCTTCSYTASGFAGQDK